MGCYKNILTHRMKIWEKEGDVFYHKIDIKSQL